ncbi:MAG: GNAT family N-acetyltransferase [Streptosporangiaceae bacterium]
MKLRQVSPEPASLRRVGQLLQIAYRTPTRERELAIYTAAQPDGLFAIFDDGEPVAAAGAITYGPFCWIGLVATHPDYSRQGLATRLTQHLIAWSREHRCTSVALDSTPDGRPVYERLGFRPLGDTVELIADTGASAAGPDAPAAEVNQNLDELLDFDRAVFGGDRAALFLALTANNDSRSYLRHDRERIDGYLFTRGGIIGPGAARDADIAADLVSTALKGGAGSVRLIVPSDSAHLHTLTQLGLRERTRITHMRLGEPRLPGHRDMLLAQTSYAAG